MHRIALVDPGGLKKGIMTMSLELSCSSQPEVVLYGIPVYKLMLKVLFLRTDLLSSLALLDILSWRYSLLLLPLILFSSR